MRRDCSARCGEIKPVICFNGAASIRGCAALRSFPQVDGNKACRIGVKKRCDIIEKLPTNILGGRHLVPEGGVIFVQKAMVIAMVNDFTGTFLDFADVNQHSGSGIGLTAEYKVGHIVAAGAVTRATFFTKKLAVLFCRKFRSKQPPRGREFDAFADGQKHDAANMLEEIAQIARLRKLGILPDLAARLPAWRNANLYGQDAHRPDRLEAFRYSFKSAR